MNEQIPQASTRVTDRLEIRDVLTRYCQSVDRLDEAALRDVFHPDATIDKGSGAMMRDPYVADVLARHASVTAASHQVSNVLVEFLDERRAFVESYGTAVERRHDGGGATDAVYRVRYADVMERRQDRWRIATRRLVVDHAMTFPAAADANEMLSGRFIGVRAAADPVELMRAAVVGAHEHAPKTLPQIAEPGRLLASRAEALRRHLRDYIETDGRVGYLRDMTATGGSEVMLHLVLRTVGRRSGETRLIPLTYAAWGDEFVIVASKGGHAEHPAWYLNLISQPEVHFQVRDKRYRGVWRIADDAEREALWPYVSTYYRGYEVYQARTERQLPIVVLTAKRPLEERFELPDELLPGLH